jgi:transglycosylase-like protein with SLT domain
MLRLRGIQAIVVACIAGTVSAGAADLPKGAKDHGAPPPMLAGPPPPMLEGPPPPMLKTPPPPMFPGYARETFVAVTTRRLHVEPSQYDTLIREIATQYGVEFALVKAVVKAESDFNRLAVSPKGARGLMQLMPKTAALHQVRDVFYPRDNIEGGCRHLRMLLDRYDGNVPLAIAAYNAGTERVEAAGGVPPIAETREYLSRVLSYRIAYQQRQGL